MHNTRWFTTVFIRATRKHAVLIWAFALKPPSKPCQFLSSTSHVPKYTGEWQSARLLNDLLPEGGVGVVSEAGVKSNEQRVSS